MSSWREVLAAVRRTQVPPRHDLRPYWRVLAFRRFQGAPEPVVRAQAFASVLEHVPLHFYDGELICGSRRGFASTDLPPGLTEAEFKAARDEHDARGQRGFWAGFDHTLADFPTLLALGIAGLLAKVAVARRTHTRSDEIIFLDAVEITLNAFAAFIRRHADATRAAGREELAACLEAIAGPPPQTLHQAMQLVWLTHLACWSEGRYAMALGRIDQYLYPFYRQDLEGGLITPDRVLELFCHLWARVDEIGEIQNICIGGLMPDGADATNEQSYVCLEATRLVQSPYTNLSARFHDATPDRFHRACFEVIRTGVGFPAIFNDHVLLAGLEEIGIPPAVARDYCMVGCIETMLAGRQQAWSDSRFNTPLCLLAALEEMRALPDRSYEDLVARFRRLLARDLAAHADRVNAYIAGFPSERFPDPFLSALTRDCIARARDINNGGAEFKRFHGICIMGLATLADSLAAVKKLVFEEEAVGFDELLAALETDFAGAEPLRLMLVNRAPKYGNDDAYVDRIAADIVHWAADACLEHEVSGGGRYVSAMAANVQNISAGREVGATPDGRHAGTPLSDAASPYFGRDMHGPTAFLGSVAAPDYHRVLTGSVINMKFDPAHFRDEAGAARFLTLTKTFVRRRIPELQFNFTGNDALRAARHDPERYRNLVVRVSGFSAYFVTLDREVQDDILRRNIQA